MRIYGSQIEDKEEVQPMMMPSQSGLVVATSASYRPRESRPQSTGVYLELGMIFLLFEEYT